MSGKPWTEERKAAYAEHVRQRWRSGVYTRRRPPTLSEAERQARVARMHRLQIRLRDDERLKARQTRAVTRTRRSPEARAIAAAVMTDRMKDPELRRRARFHCVRINKNLKVRRRQWAGRRRKQKAGTG